MILLERDCDLVEQMAVQLGRFIAAKEPNTRCAHLRICRHFTRSHCVQTACSYLGLENMGRLSMLPQVALVVKRNQHQIAESLHDPDISIRRRALDLLYGMCDTGNAQDIVKELLDYLIVSDFAIREELVLKIAILAEKYAPTQRWYIDVVLAMMDKAGDFVSDDIWYANDTMSPRAFLIWLTHCPCQAPCGADRHQFRGLAGVRRRAGPDQAA